MTPLDPPREPRVSDGLLGYFVGEGVAPLGPLEQSLALDLRDARAQLAEVTAENARLRALIGESLDMRVHALAESSPPKPQEDPK